MATIENDIDPMAETPDRIRRNFQRLKKIIDALAAATSSVDFEEIYRVSPIAQDGSTTVSYAPVTNAIFAYAVYVGKAHDAYTSCNITFVTTVSAASVTWAEVAVATGTLPAGANAPVLTTVGFTSVATQVTGTAGTFVVTVSLSGVTAGQGLWLVFGRSGGSGSITLVSSLQPTGTTTAAAIRKFFPQSNTRPQSLSATSMTVSSTIGSGIPFLIGEFTV